VGDAKSAVDQLNLINRTVPVTALVVGIALLVGGLVLLAVPRRRHPAVPEGPWVDELLEQREPILV
jgi:hypothetical protein